MTEKIIGILGGMGPEATSDLYLRIIRTTPAEKDQDHFRVIIDSNAKIEDRTPAILGEGPSPLPKLVETGKNLEKAGADFIIMPCNTAHFFFDRIEDELDIPVLHMIGLSAKYTRRNISGIMKLGLLATDGTISSRLYQKSYESEGFSIIIPEVNAQRRVMDAIYSYIKTGDHETGGRMLLETARGLISGGSEAIICGCTEVSLVLNENSIDVPLIDPLQILAEEAVKYASE